jgi:hypothetical protein
MKFFIFRFQILPICFLLVFSACRETHITVQEIKLLPDSLNLADDTVCFDPQNKTFYSRLSKKESSGLRYSYHVPKEIKGKELYIVARGRARTNYAHSNTYITIVVYDEKNDQLLWRALPLRFFYVEVNEWSPFRDSLFLPGSFDGKAYHTIQIMTTLGNSERELFDVDTLSLKIKSNI